jgi:hypothetical protein
LSREFAEKTQAPLGLFRRFGSKSEPKSQKFPVFSLMIRDFDAESSLHQTAASATESFSVYGFATNLRNPRVCGQFRSAPGSGECSKSSIPPIRR